MNNRVGDFFKEFRKEEAAVKAQRDIKTVVACAGVDEEHGLQGGGEL